MGHDLDHVGEALLHLLAPVPGGEAGGQRLDRPAQLAQLLPLVVALRSEGPPLDDVRVEQVPVADGADPRTDVGTGAHQALRLQDAERLADDGPGDLEPLADLLGHQRAVGAQVAGDDHLAELLHELAVQTASTGACGAPADAAQFGLRAVPCRGTDAVGPGSLRVGVAVEFARVRQAGVCGAGGGHHGVRKGSHASFVGRASNCLEGFGEKHTKG